ncbi:MAG: AAA family ATPase [Flavobacterium lindanitolerans]|uniref:AAA family ATPase n=1 Tax=Flavobacterium lindanitolerans TaxID=428988 RepID=UPI001A4891DB|nr:AAA family ATPase [Flavobacterium lindanitolerans]MBL7868918.1 AAA family ATPase [Flavobacterium lindanitolerans]
MKYQNNNFFILTGGPGVGKTSVLNELEKSGYTVMPETARAIIKEQMATDGEALPWKNKEIYMQLMVEASAESYREAISKNSLLPVFFDRGILDAVCYARMVGLDLSNEIQEIAEHYQYNTKIFIFPPWQAIYETDEERKQDWKEAEATFEAMKKTYQDYGYEIIEVPKDTVEKRKEFIINRIKQNTSDED